jgi:hypothetical protein
MATVSANVHLDGHEMTLIDSAVEDAGSWHMERCAENAARLVGFDIRNAEMILGMAIEVSAVAD